MQVEPSLLWTLLLLVCVGSSRVRPQAGHGSSSSSSAASAHPRHRRCPSGAAGLTGLLLLLLLGRCKVVLMDMQIAVPLCSRRNSSSCSSSHTLNSSKQKLVQLQQAAQSLSTWTLQQRALLLLLLLVRAWMLPAVSHLHASAARYAGPQGWSCVLAGGKCLWTVKSLDPIGNTMQI
jgi:hypothetical protein